MESIKRKAINYIQSDIETLAQQSDSDEIRAFVNRIRGAYGVLQHLNVISIDESADLESKMATARKIAAARV